MKYSELLIANRDLEKKLKGQEYPVTVLSNITVNQLKEIFEYTARKEGIFARVTIGNYDTIVQDSLQYSQSKLVVIFWELANIIDGLQYKAGLFDQEKLQELLEKVKGEMQMVFDNLRETSRVVINKFSSLVFNYHNLEKNQLDHIADVLNRYLVENKPSNFTIIEIDKIFAGLSVEKSVDMRYFYSSKALYSIDFFKSWSSFVMPLVRSLNGKAKKALIFDCDNTLWKGILGEDGFDHIVLASTQTGGAPYEEVQSLARQLISEGIILGLCSKNNAPDVNEVLEKHPKMVLKNEHLTIKKVNWNDKVTNLEEIAKTLNIGKDSLVFVDDSNFEIHFVNESLPEITTLQVPENISDYPKVIRENLGLFYNVSKTREDLKRVNMYKEQVRREEAKGGFDNLESYIKSLDIKLDIHTDDPDIVPRMSQMTQKTNQFNLTTKRYSEADIRNFVDSDNHKVVAIGVSDKFGDNGITGLAILKTKDDQAEIDTLLMSCRIIGRNIEFRYFDYLMDLLKEERVTTIKATYLKTLKNDQVRDFYDKLGFELISEENDNKYYHIKTAEYKPHEINYMRIENGR
jgi:FkbH-like protein